jgi:hypothetical protein
MIIFVSVSLFFLVYFLPAIVVLVRRPNGWQLIGLLDLLAAWTVIGWIAALWLACTRPPARSTVLGPPMLSPDGRWWWDGQVWRPMPPQLPGTWTRGGRT